MQNKHETFFSFFGGPTYGEGGGGPLVGPKAQVFPKNYFDGTPYQKSKIIYVKVTLEAQLGLIGGTMGLLTGLSILSGVEIIYYVVR